MFVTNYGRGRMTKVPGGIWAIASHLNSLAELDDFLISADAADCMCLRRPNLEAREILPALNAMADNHCVMTHGMADWAQVSAAAGHGDAKDTLGARGAGGVPPSLPAKPPETERDNGHRLAIHWQLIDNWLDRMQTIGNHWGTKEHIGNRWKTFGSP